MQRYDIAVLGRGLTGSAAARHCAELGASVLLVGAEEPADRAGPDAVFASHYDAGRITRVLDPSPARASLALRSLQRHRELERLTGISFFHEVGHLAVGPASSLAGGYLCDLMATARATGVEVEQLGESELRERFPLFVFEPGCHGLHQRSLAGFIDPRAMLAAQCARLEALGGTLCIARLSAVEPSGPGMRVRAADGRSWCADRVILAAGTFLNSIDYPGPRMDIGVETLSAVLARLAPAQAERLSGLPSLIYKPRDPNDNLYMVPPTRYPDGHSYLKMGSPWPHNIERGLEGLRAWFREPLAAPLAEGLRQRLARFMPGLRLEALHFDTCAAQHTPAGFARLGVGADPRLLWCIGCGAGAKSADEVGRLAAVLAVQGRWDSDLPAAWFAPRQGESFTHPPLPGVPYTANAA